MTLGFSTALVSRVVTQRLGNPASDQPLTFVGDPPAQFVVDGSTLCQPLPAIEGMVVADNYLAWLQRKLYIFSAGHAACAYLGYLRRIAYIHEAIRHQEIQAVVLAAMAEGQRGLALYHGSEVAGEGTDLLEMIDRFGNAAIGDLIERVGRDPIRKLGAKERLVGAARLAERAGVHPRNLALAIAAALYFDHPEDAAAALLRQEIRTLGIGLTLHKRSGLNINQGLGRLVFSAWSQLAMGCPLLDIIDQLGAH